AGTAAPWHIHPGAQEILFVIEGSVTVEIEGQAPTVLKAGQNRSDSCRDSSSCAQRRQRRGKSIGDPQPSRQGQTVRRPREEGDVASLATVAIRKRRGFVPVTAATVSNTKIG